MLRQCQRVVCGLGLAALLTTAAAPRAAFAQGEEYIKAHYTKYEYKIAMRDGKRLFTSVYVPKNSDERYPIMLTRTPYSVAPYGVDAYKGELGPSAIFGKEGYIFVYQDVRGRWMSEGEFVDMRPELARHDSSSEVDETTDTFDTIDWLVKNVPNNNGKVGQWGISYPGFYTACGMIDAHPALKAASPQAPVADWFAGDDWHHNGALYLPHAFGFLSVQGKPRPGPTTKFKGTFDFGTTDGYQFYLNLGPLPNADKRYFHGDVAFWNELMRHGTYDDFWKARNLRPHLKQIRPAVMTVGGWFDAENLYGALEVYKNVEASSPGAKNMLVMGPWLHGGWARGEGASLGPVHFNSKTSEFYREQIEAPFFAYHLKGKGEMKHPEAWVFETGRDQWQKYDAWPPRSAQKRSLYLLPGGKLGFEAPAGSSSESGEAYDEYTSDPAKPVPFVDFTSIGMTPEYPVADQRFAARRTDVLTYTTEPLERDMTVLGPIQADLVVSTSGTDSDWVVKLVDVYPDDYPTPGNNLRGMQMGGYQQLVRGDVMRGKFRKSLERPEAFVPGERTEVHFALPDINHTFRTGHRVMVQVQSSWFPLVDRNPQTFCDIYNATEADFKKATQRVYRSHQAASRLGVLVLP